MDEGGLMERYQDWLRAGLVPDPDDPRPARDIVPVGRMYDGRTIVRFHRGDWKYQLGVQSDEQQ